MNDQVDECARVWDGWVRWMMSEYKENDSGGNILLSGLTGADCRS